MTDERSPETIVAQHTPGPWTVEIMDSDTCPSGYITGHIISPLHTYAGNSKSRTDSITDPSSMTWADAHLIAAAPDLLAALKAALEQTEDGLHPAPCGETDCWVERARAAIAAAEGEARP